MWRTTAGLLAVVVVAAVQPEQARAISLGRGVLWGAEGGNGVASPRLLRVNPETGAVTAVGPIGFAVTGLAVDPTTGVLYGSTNTHSVSSPNSLVTINRQTGAGTVVGAYGGTNVVADLTFNGTGQLFGWDEDTDDLVTIDKATGAVTVVGDAGVSTRGDGLTFCPG